MLIEEALAMFNHDIRKRPRPSGFIKRVLSIVASLTLGNFTGCGLSLWMSGKGEGGYAYVLELGDADSITKWGIQQVDDDRIYDAMCALSSYAGQNHSDPNKVDAGENGIIRIYNKLIAGWPGYTGVSRYREEDAKGPLPSKQVQKNLNNTITGAYMLLLQTTDRKWFLSVEPDPTKYPDRYRAWWDLGKLYNVAQLKEYPVPKDNPR
jgi:hypothetical protein